MAEAGGRLLCETGCHIQHSSTHKALKNAQKLEGSATEDMEKEP